MCELLFVYIVSSILFLSLCVGRISDLKTIEATTRNRDTKLFCKRLHEKEVVRCKAFVFWPVTMLYEVWKIFKK